MITGFSAFFKNLPEQHRFNEFYARDTSKKIRAVKQAKAQKGERVNGQVPYGYIADPNDRNHLLPDPETAHIVKQIFAMYVRGDRMILSISVDTFHARILAAKRGLAFDPCNTFLS